MYKRTIWMDNVTPVNAENLNKIELQLEKLDRSLGVRIISSLIDESQLPATGEDRTAYLINGELYIWTDEGWSNQGKIIDFLDAGDMHKSTYDTNDDGIVDMADVAITANRADVANRAEIATTAERADTATTASVADVAITANKADVATTANTADFAITANKADTATNASMADVAITANRADTADIATSADKLSTPRTIAITGNATGSAVFDGSEDININVTINGGNADTVDGKHYNDITNYIDDTISSIKIGGRNLLKGTRFTGTLDTNYWNTRGDAYSLSIDTTVQYNGFNSLKIVANNIGSSGKDIIIKSLVMPEVSTEYIFSFYAKASEEITLTVRWGYGSTSNTVVIGTEWNRYEVIAKTGSQEYQDLLPYFDKIATLWIALPKLEKGNKATDWTPAYEDMDMSASFLPISGGTLTGPITLPPDKYYLSNGLYGINMRNSDIININCLIFADVCDNANEGIIFKTNSGTMTLWVDGSGVPYLGSNKMWHAGNDGSGSGLDADTLDGKHFSDIQNQFVKKVETSSVYTYYNVCSYENGNANQTGIIKIQMPKTWTNTMMMVEIDIYDYTENTGYSKVLIGGYNYSSGQWYSSTVRILGNLPNNTVRLAHDGTRNCILIGTTSTVWQYPKVAISKFQATHLGKDGWETGWSISLITSESGLTNILAPTANFKLNADTVDGKHATDFLPITGGTLTGITKAQSNTSYTTAQIRNIILSTSDANASQMQNGEIWIKYS